MGPRCTVFLLLLCPSLIIRSDGVDHKLYIVQARPETVASQKSLVKIEQYDIKRETVRCLSNIDSRC